MTSADFKYYSTDKKKAIAYFYFKTCLINDLLDYKGDIYSDIQTYKDDLLNDPTYDKIAWTYYNLACCLYATKDFQSAKNYFQKSAEENSRMRADAYFALSCLKIILNESADDDLKNSILNYEEGSSFLGYVNEIFNTNNNELNFENSLTIIGQKTNGEIIGKLESGNYSKAEIELCYKTIKEFLILETKYPALPDNTNGYFKIQIAFINSIPYYHLSLCEISGFTYKEVHVTVNKIFKNLNRSEI